MIKKGFTLSEVLITLAIIGVITVITLPSVMANHRREEASAKIKKFYSMLCNASTRAKADGKDWEYWAESTDTTSDSTSGTTDTAKNFVQEYLLPYLVYYKTERNGTLYYVYLNDGTFFQVGKGSCLDFVIDINGEKKPNREGRDKYRFLYCPYSYKSYWLNSAQVMPYQPKLITTREQALDYCKQSGAYCSALLFMDNWQFKQDYPYSI